MCRLGRGATESVVGRKGDAVAMYDGRPNAELFLATGSVEDQNPSDCLAMKAELVKADRLYSSKKSIVESSGFSVSEVLPVIQHTLLCLCPISLVVTKIGHCAP